MRLSVSDLAALNQEQLDERNRERLLELGGAPALAMGLGSDAARGLTAHQVSAQRAEYGTNDMPPPATKSWLDLFVDSFDDPTLIVLIVSAAVSLAVGIYDDPQKGWIEGAAILVAVLIVAVVTATNDFSKEQQFQALNAVKDDIEVKVLRDGAQVELNVKDVVVGDVLRLEAGDKISADAVYLSGLECVCNESSLTGEPAGVLKSAAEEGDPFLLSGCQVASGYCEALVIAVGRESRWGRIKAGLEVEAEDTPLQEKLEAMANTIGLYGGAMALLTAGTMVGLWYASCAAPTWEQGLEQLLEAFIIAVTIVVVAVPEGLPLAVTISLAYSTTKMLQDMNLIRVLAACETMGNATTICSDKTGTLTMNRMTVVALWSAEGLVESTKSTLPKDAAIADALSRGAALNSSAELRSSGKVVGSSTEGALLSLLAASGADYAAIRAEHEGRKELRVPFNSKRKRMSTLVELGGRSRGAALLVKGASEVVLGLCGSYMDAGGKSRPFSRGSRGVSVSSLRKTIAQMEDRALRVVAIAQKECASKLLGAGGAQDIMDEERDLTLVAICGIQDPLREDVPDAVRTCQKCGIDVKMVTGDSLNTAKAIARDCGILTDGDAIEGPQLRVMTPAQLDEALPRLQVVARSSPSDKLLLVSRLNGHNLPKTRAAWESAHPGRDWETEKDLLLPGYWDEWIERRREGKGRREVVGVTGDGTNDAPALRAADVGLSMGVTGTDVAKEASDIIIMDDNFKSIVKAVLWGRSVFDNIRKFLQFQLTVNVVALVLTLLAAAYGLEPPLNAVMMLWVNLIMDTMGALALGTEAPDAALLDRPPYKRDAPLISRVMWRNVLVQSAFQLAVLLALLLCEEGTLAQVFDVGGKGSAKHFTIVFNVFVLCQVFNEFNARSITSDANVLKGIHRNPMFLAIVVFTLGAQYGIVTYGGDFTKTAPLTLEEWKTCAAIAAVTVPLGILMRFLPVSEDPSTFATEKPPAKRQRSAAERWATSFVAAGVVVVVPAVLAALYQRNVFEDLLSQGRGALQQVESQLEGLIPEDAEQLGA